MEGKLIIEACACVVGAMLLAILLRVIQRCLSRRRTPWGERYPLMRETIAAVQHEIWTHWMECLIAQGEDGYVDRIAIPAEVARRWRRQMDTPYADLSEEEKESDRDQAEKVMAAIFKLMTQG